MFAPNSNGSRSKWIPYYMPTIGLKNFIVPSLNPYIVVVVFFFNMDQPSFQFNRREHRGLENSNNVPSGTHQSTVELYSRLTSSQTSAPKH